MNMMKQVKKAFELTSMKSLEDKERAFAELEEVWNAEKAALSGTQHIKGELNRLEWIWTLLAELVILNRMSELQYGRIPELEKATRPCDPSRDAGNDSASQNKVTDNEIADVLSKQTGIPVSKMLEAEREKLLRMEEVLTHSCYWSN